MNVKRKDAKHQFFNSTEDRFKHSIFAADEGSNHSPSKVGPGAYDPKGTFDYDPKKYHKEHVN